MLKAIGTQHDNFKYFYSGDRFNKSHMLTARKTCVCIGRDGLAQLSQSRGLGGLRLKFFFLPPPPAPFLLRGWAGVGGSPQLWGWGLHGSRTL
jgi:hypothetical protein